MTGCRILISDETLSSAVRAVLELCGIACLDEEGGILVTDLPDADILPSRGCVMLAWDVNTAAESPQVRVLQLPLSYGELIDAVRSFESGGTEIQAVGQAYVSAETGADPSAEKTTESDCRVLVRDGCVSFGEKSVQLTEREMMLFELMASRPGEIVTRDEIRNCVWRENDGTTNVSDVYISYLRKKLMPLFGRGVIITVRGQGYMLVLP